MCTYLEVSDVRLDHILVLRGQWHRPQALIGPFSRTLDILSKLVVGTVQASDLITKGDLVITVYI